MTPKTIKAMTNETIDTKNKTQIKRYKSAHEFDYILSGSSSIINLLVARLLSDKGYTVCVLNKKEEPVGFERLYTKPWFFGELCKSLGVKAEAVRNEKEAVRFLIGFAKNPDNITYYGSNYRFVDFGYDDTINYFLANRTTTKKPTEIDSVIYGTLGRQPMGWLRSLLPRRLKITQLIGDKMIVARWSEYLKGWAWSTEGHVVTYDTHRPNVTTIFTATRALDEVHSEKEALRLLTEEIDHMVKTINRIPVKEKAH